MYRDHFGSNRNKAVYPVFFLQLYLQTNLPSYKFSPYTYLPLKMILNLGNPRHTCDKRDMGAILQSRVSKTVAIASEKFINLNLRGGRGNSITLQVSRYRLTNRTPKATNDNKLPNPSFPTTWMT